MRRAIEILKNERLATERHQATDRKWLESTPSMKIKSMLETNIEYRQEILDHIDDAIERLEEPT